MESLYLMCFIEIIILILVFFIKENDFLSPGVAFAFVFLFSTIIACMYCKHWTMVKHYNVIAATYIICGIFLFCFVDCLIYKYYRNKNTLYINYGRIDFDISNWKICIIIIIDLLILYMFYKYSRNLINSYGAMTSYKTDSVSAAYRSLYGHDNKVNDVDQMSSLLRYSLYFLQSSAYVCAYPFVYGVFVKKQNFIINLKFLFPTIIFIIYGFLCGSRGDIIKIVISMFCMSYILFLKTRGWSINNLKKLITVGLRILLIVLIVFFLSSFIIGRNAIGNSVIKSFALQIAGYAGAPIVHFSQYIDNPVNKVNFGEESFYSLYTFLQAHGMKELNAVKHLEYSRLVGGIEGNVYTFFRRPLHDFGVFGMFLFTLIVAWLMSILYYKYIKYAKYKSKDKFGIWLIIYSSLFQWIVYSSIDQISGEFISVSFIFRIIFIIIIYIFLFCLDLKKGKIRFN